MYAVIQSGGKQYRVAEGDHLKVEKLTEGEGEALVFDKVLMMVDGENIQMGAPFLNVGEVKATVVKHGRGKKLKIVKLRRRKNSRRQAGHRQDFTEVKIEAIAFAKGQDKKTATKQKAASENSNEE